jgi:hypothetical protein
MKVTVRTNFTPTFTYDSTTPPSGASGILQKLLQPSVVATDVPLIGDVDYTPYGPPSEWGLLLLLSLAGLTAYGGYALARKFL